jgi:hypothetical protein
MRENATDPWAAVDEPLDATGLAESVAWAEMESQSVHQEILRDSVGVAEAADRTGRSRQSIERLRRTRRLLGFRVGPQWRYPEWQFSRDVPGGVIPGLNEVIRVLGLSPAGAAFWLLKPAERLGGRPPIELLRQLQTSLVVELAREQGLLP